MLLEMKHIVKTYGRVVANNDVSLSLNEGEILAIVGENGAGKTTIMKILYGLEIADSGEILLRGKPVTIDNPRTAMRLGIGMVQQHFMLFNSLNVTENIVYNHEIAKNGFLDPVKNRDAVSKLCKEYSLQVEPDKKIQDCPVGIQQRVEILKTLYQNANIIIFDEPSAVLTPPEVDELLETMKYLAAGGKSIILITHKLNEVMTAADRVVVMRNGSIVGEKKKENTSIEELSYMMIGRQIANNAFVIHPTGRRLLNVEHLVMGSISGKKILNDVSLHVDSGEIVGIAGVSGNGQSELIRCITGLQKEYEGRITICDKDTTNKSVMAVRKAGMSHIPEDRYYWGSAREADLADNYLMGDENSPACSKRGVLNLKKIRQKTEDIIQEYAIKADSSYQKIKELSGGNAQKLITAREIERDTPLTIACEPTRGVDIGAMEFIHNRLIEKRQDNGGILLVSSELSEILKLSDRIYVIYEGQLSYEFKRGNVDEHKLGLLMMGGKVNE